MAPAAVPLPKGPHLAPPGQPLFKFDKKTPQRLVGAGALLIAGYILFVILWPLRWSLLSTWVVVEVIFYVLYWRPRYAELNEQPEKHEPKNLDGMKTFQRFLRFCKDLPKGIDYQAYYSGWFRGAPFRDIKRGNAEDFMAYGFFYRSREQMKAMGMGHVTSQMVDQLEKTWGIRFEPGFNKAIRFMGHLWEPLNASWRPLFFYLCTELIGCFARQLLKRWGFDHHKHNGLSYFTLNVGRAKACSRNTSNSALADAAAAAMPGSAAPTVSRPAAALPAQEPHQHAASSKERTRFAKEAAAEAAAAAAAAGGGGSEPASRSSSRSTSPSKDPSRVGSANKMDRAKSSPFEAGPPDWTPFADPETPLPPTVSGELAAAAAAASSASTASAASSSSSGCSSSAVSASVGSGAPLLSSRQATANMSAVHAAASTQPAGLMQGLSMHTSIMLRSAANPLQGALSEGLGSADTPVLFLHGVGGLPAYLEMILHVMGLGHPVIVVEFKGVSMRLGKVFTADEVADSVVGILDKLGVKEACVVGHSYGTFIAGMLARHHRKRVHTLCLIDPVCFGMFMPHLLHNFLYRVPTKRGHKLSDLVEYVKDAVRLVASREMHVCATFARRFYWSDLNLWPEDLAPGSVVLLSGKDDLMDAAEVKDMLDVAGHVKVMYNHELTHGAFLLDYEVKQAIVAEMRGLLARSGSAVVGLARPVLARTLTFIGHGFGVAPGRVSMKRGGGNGRYYVEDHSNQLVRTFTGNLTKMLSQMPGTFSKLGSSEGGAAHGSSAAAAGGSSSSNGAGPSTRPGEWSATRLMQTFSGPVRRRLGARSWGAEGSVREQDLPVGPVDSTAASPTAAGTGQKRSKGLLGSAAAAWEGRPAGLAQSGVSRIDEGEGGEEL